MFLKFKNKSTAFLLKMLLSSTADSHSGNKPCKNAVFIKLKKKMLFKIREISSRVLYCEIY